MVDSTKKTIIFIGGWTTSASCYEKLLIAMEDAGHTVHFIRPNWGTTGYRKALLISKSREVRDFMIEKRITRATLIGHSLGGPIALRVVLESPDAVERVVLINPVGLVVNDNFMKLAVRSVRSFARDVRRAWGVGSLEELVRSSWETVKAIARHPVLHLFSEPIMMASIRTGECLFYVADREVSVTLLTSDRDILTQSSRSIRRLKDLGLIEQSISYAPGATHNAPIIEGTTTTIIAL